MPLWPLVDESPGEVVASARAGRAGMRLSDRLTNELVRVTGKATGPASFDVEFFDGVEWRAKAITLWRTSDPLTFARASILQNRPEIVTAQFEASLETGGRVTVDVTLQPGQRHALFQMAHNAPATLQVSPYPLEPMTRTNERELSDSPDADGHRLLIGSPRAWTHTAGTGLLTRAAAQQLTFYVGLELSGAGAGDLAVDLSMQAIGHLSVTHSAWRR